MRLPECLDNRHVNVVSLSALGTGLLYSQEIFLVLISARSRVDSRAMVQLEGLKSMKNHNYPVGTRTRDLPAFGAMPQPNSYQMETLAKLGNHQTYHHCFGGLRSVDKYFDILSLTFCFVYGYVLCLPIYICISYNFKGVTIK